MPGVKNRRKEQRRRIKERTQEKNRKERTKPLQKESGNKYRIKNCRQENLMNL